MRLTRNPLRTSLAAVQLSALALLCSYSPLSLADGTLTPGGSLGENMRVSLDLSSRITHFDRADETGYTNVAGLDLHKVFSGNDGDIGTLTVQLYWTRIDNLIMRPGFFDGPDDTELVYRIVNFNYTGFGTQAPHIRVGHFEIPYGLEHTIDTNGNLRDYTHGRNLGVKADWGVSVNGGLPTLEYEVSYTLGGGQEAERKDGSYVWAGRLGTPRDDNQVYGVALYHAELKNTERNRLGLDAMWYYDLYGLFAQLDIGEDADNDVLNGIVELNWRNPQETWLLFLQNQYFSTDRSDGDQQALRHNLGVQYTPDSHWDFSAQYQHDSEVFDGAPEERIFSLQARYRF